VSSSEGAERSLEGEAREEVSWEGRASGREDGFGRHRKLASKASVYVNRRQKVN